MTDNLNALRVRPATNSASAVTSSTLRIEPEARVSRHLDYFGTEVIEFGIPTSHENLTIDVRARVVTSEPAEPPEGSWESLQSARLHRCGGRVRAAVGRISRRWRDSMSWPRNRIRQSARDLAGTLEAVPARFEYRPGATYVGSTIKDLLQAGGGVCQDFVHLSLVLLRRHGIAARYVSGYLWAAPEEGGNDSLEVDTHAWVEALLPGSDGHGEPVWVGADPTNRRLTGETHVKIGHGRFYSDVSPVKGLYMGGTNAELSASVTMSRLDPQASARA